MIESIRFQNFKVLREATLPLGRFSLIVGPNGSGKSTALSAFTAFLGGSLPYDRIVSIGASGSNVEIHIDWAENSFGKHERVRSSMAWVYQGPIRQFHVRWAWDSRTNGEDEVLKPSITKTIQGVRVFSLEAACIAEPAQLVPSQSLSPDGQGLAGVLDHLRDHAPERFEQLNKELQRWLPEFDRILFSVPQSGMRSFSFRTKRGHEVQASDLSDGTLTAIAILTIAYLPEPPPIVAFEEPDRGIHPRLLREVRDALYRLAYPEEHGETRAPVQVIATTHSPYLLDLFKSRLEEVVIAEKTPDGARFERLSDRPDIEEIVQDTSLGEAWFTGVLGGAPVTP